jgi:hypothetical protein
MGRWPWILSFREKKQNSNGVKGVGVLSLLGKVKKCKKGPFSAFTSRLAGQVMKCLTI